MQLSDTIIKKIASNGPVSFHDFMEMCLYYPEAGYYTSARDKIGVNGDFYTTSTLTTVFGAMIARQLEQMWEITGRQEFAIVEYGAGTGMLCHDIIDHLRSNPAFYEKLHYYIIEKSSAMRQKERSHLKEKVSWIDSIYEIAPFTGCVLSNELLDNFAIHHVVMEDELMEVFVTYENGFREILKPANTDLVNYFEELNIVLPKGFHTEVNLEAITWIREIADCLKAGFVMTVDYGYTSAELYADRRRNGTLLCYHRHSVNDQPYCNIGDQDITSHVNFTALSHWGAKYSLAMSGLTTQANFFVSLGYEEFLSKLLSEGTNNYTAFRKYASLKHTLLVDMGQKYKVLIQHKGVSPQNLRCFGNQTQTSEIL
jgi:SAM-dependent MidA family methyltransferase